MAKNGPAKRFHMELNGNTRFVFGKTSGFSVGRRARLGARDIAAKPERVEFAIERRAPDLQPPRDFRHLPAVMREREADDLGLDVLERTHLATAVDQA